ncbi:MAG: SGNH/GDSL hydrolase family protein [Planctomycetota bacterium]
MSPSFLRPALAAVLLLAAPALAKDWAEHFRQRVAAFQEENRRLDPAGRHVVLVGDSLTEGFNASRVARFLPRLAPRVLNRGISSDRVGPPRGVLSRLEASVLDTRPAHVVLLIGVNQIGRDGSGIKGALAHYEQLLKRLAAEASGVPVTLVTTTPARAGYDALNPHIVTFDEGVRKLAQRYGHGLIDLHPLFKGEDGRLRPELSADGLHWTDRGYELYGREIERAVAAAEAKAKQAAGQGGAGGTRRGLSQPVEGIGR